MAMGSAPHSPDAGTPAYVLSRAEMRTENEHPPECAERTSGILWHLAKLLGWKESAKV